MQSEYPLTEAQRAHFKNRPWAERVDQARLTLHGALFICQDLISQEERKAVGDALDEFIEHIYTWCQSAGPSKDNEPIA